MASESRTAVSHPDAPALVDVSPRSRRSGLILAVVLIGAFMAVLDVAVVNVAIPSIQRDLHAGFGALELVISAYTLVYASLLVTGGRLGDIYGRRPLFIAGVVVFSGASALCGIAPSIDVLIVARAIQGIGGAMLYPQVLSIIQVTFTGQDRGRALGIFGCLIGVAAIAGQIIGGFILAANLFGLEWRPVFLLNVPVGILAVMAAMAVLPRERGEPQARLDAVGVLLAAVTVLLLVVPLLEGRDAGWPAWMLVSLAASLPAGAAFVAYERRLSRRGGSPLVPLRLFSNSAFGNGVPIAALFMASNAGFLITFAIYLQVGLGFSPLQSALTYTPNALGFFMASLIAPRLVPLLGRSVLTCGYVVAALGLLATAGTVAAAGSHLIGWELAPTLFLAGLGQGLGMTPLVGTIISGLRPTDAGAGAGVVTTTLQVGNALGVALISLLFFSLLGTLPTAPRYATAFALVLPVAAALVLLAAVLVQRLPRSPMQPANSLIELLPGWASGFAYSMFLMTGGRMADQLFSEILEKVTERRTRRVHEAPMAPGDFLVYHFEAAADDKAWLNYLIREALAYGSATVPHEADRLPMIQAQVDEMRRRQELGLVTTDFDPAVLRLLAFALTNYPRILPQITRMTTGQSPEDPAFKKRWGELLRGLGDRLGPGHK
ncbi:MAG TPA: MFS transporter [Candidatus Dormibacteraeota bacterium]|jgi:EmrB/QacA subfamily drug resistance transporter